MKKKFFIFSYFLCRIRYCLRSIAIILFIFNNVLMINFLFLMKLYKCMKYNKLYNFFYEISLKKQNQYCIFFIFIIL